MVRKKFGWFRFSRFYYETPLLTLTRQVALAIQSMLYYLWSEIASDTLPIDPSVTSRFSVYSNARGNWSCMVFRSVQILVGRQQSAMLAPVQTSGSKEQLSFTKKFRRFRSCRNSLFLLNAVTRLTASSESSA